jgi:hypothetical protein
MYVSNEKWAEIVAATQEKIANWNASAAKHALADTFECDEQQQSKHILLITKHKTGSGYLTEHHALAWELETGEVRRTKLVLQKGRVVSFKTSHPDPKSWQALANKTAAEMVKKLKLTDFLLLIGSKATSVESSMIYRGQVFTAEESKQLEQICRDQNVSMEEAIRTLREKAA